MTDSQSKKKWTAKRTFAVIGIIILLYALITFLSSFCTSAPQLKISPETVYIENPPLNEYGTVDYISWLNEKCSKDVTPEENIMVDFIKIFGTDAFIPNKTEDDLIARLDIYNPPQTGTFIRLDEYTKNEETCDLLSHILDGNLWQAKDYPEIAAWLEANRPAFDMLTAAADKNFYYSPATSEYHTFFAHALPSLSRIRQASQAMAARCSLLIAENKLEEAWPQIIAIRKIGLLIKSTTDKPISIIEQLVGLAIREISSNQAMILLANENLTDFDCAKFLRQWQTLPSPEINISAYFLSERLYTLAGIMSFYDGRAEMNEFFDNDGIQRKFVDINKMLKTANKLHDLMLDQYQNGGNAYTREYNKITGNSRYLNKQSITALVYSLPQPYKTKISTDALANRYFGIFSSSLNGIIPLYKRERSKYDLVELGLALRCYNFKHGHYPEKLAQLSPEFLKEIPTDPLADAPYHYKRTDKGFILYGVGKNRVDDGGKKWPAGRHDDRIDIVVEMPFKNPPQPEEKPKPKRRRTKRKTSRQTPETLPAETQPANDD